MNDKNTKYLNLFKDIFACGQDETTYSTKYVETYFPGKGPMFYNFARLLFAHFVVS